MASTKKRSAPPAKSSSVAAARGKSQPKRALPTTLWENLKSIGGALVIFLFIRTFFVEAFRIPSGSMIPTLLVGDWLFVNKLVYGPHIPFTKVNLPGYSDPKRGEVVVFVSPYQPDEAAIGNDPPECRSTRNPSLSLRSIPRIRFVVPTNCATKGVAG